MQDKKYTYSNRAALDVKKIYKNTAKEWDRAQADKYDKGLLETIHLLADRPNIGHKCKYLKTEHRRFRYERQIIFYRKRKDDIYIVRILHDRMDYESH